MNRYSVYPVNKNLRSNSNRLCVEKLKSHILKQHFVPGITRNIMCSSRRETTKISITINEKIINEIDSIIDNIFIRNRSQAIEYLVQNSLGGNKTAVILSGGPEKKISIPGIGYRPLAKLNGSTVIEKAIKKLRENGFKKIYIVARHKILTKIFETWANRVT